MTDANAVRNAADAVKGLLEAAPIYEDGLQPAVIEVGTHLETVAKSLRIVLGPIKALIWGYDQIERFITTEVGERLKDVPEEHLQTPQANIAVPVIEALRYTAEEKDLRDLYANLLATSIDERTAKYAHPSFVHSIKNLSPDEARIVKILGDRVRIPVIDVQIWNRPENTFTTQLTTFWVPDDNMECQYTELVPAYLENLRRLGIVRIPTGIALKDEAKYEKIESSPVLEPFSKMAKEDGKEIKFIRKIVEITMYGRQFAQACIDEHGVSFEEVRVTN